MTESQLNYALERLLGLAKGIGTLSIQDAKRVCEYIMILETQLLPIHARNDLSV